MKSRHLHTLFLVLFGILFFLSNGYGQKRDSETLSPQYITPDPNIERGQIPTIKFKINDPCASDNLAEQGLPWEKSTTEKIELPAGINPEIPQPLTDYEQLSNFSYNAAVSMAFEGMRLLYGTMSKEDYQQFEELWQPLFDFPSQEIVEYLNKLNPLIAEFLGVREAYFHRLAGLQVIYFDAAVALQEDDREAWEQVMSEGVLQSNTLVGLEVTMQKLANMIQELGNPPNPLEAKCEAEKRYKRMFPEKEKGTVGECWSGYQKSDIQNPNMDELFEPLFRHVTFTRGKYQIIELGEDGHLENINSDLELLAHIQVQQVHESYSPKAGMEEAEGTFGKFTYPMIKRFPNTSFMKLMLLSEQSNVGKEHEDYVELQYFSNTTKRYLSRMAAAGFFYKHAMLWSYFNKWDNYELDQNGLISGEALSDFEDDMRQEMTEYLEAQELSRKERRARKKELDEKYDVADLEENGRDVSEKDSIAAAEQSRQQSIASYRENIQSLDQEINRERSIVSDLRVRLSSAKSTSEQKNLSDQIRDCHMRIMGFESTRTSFYDNIRYLETGENRRTRQMFDDYARQKFIQDTKKKAADRDATSRIFEGAFRQVKILPPEMQRKAREYILKALDPETVASGDLEKALKVRNTLNEMILGDAGQDYAQAQLAIVDSEENEFWAKSTIAAAGAAVVGLGSAHLTSIYGAEAAATIYGAKAIGAVYGGATGLLSGGPEEAVKQSLNFWSPWTGAGVSFYDGYQTAAKNPQLSENDRLWEATKTVGVELLINQGIHLGSKGFSKLALITRGPNSRLFKPIAKTTRQRSKEIMQAMRFTKDREQAKDAIKAFDNMNAELGRLKLNSKGNATKITQLEKELSQLSASMNADYYAKWQFKYKANPTSRMNFDKMVQANYKKMTPQMINKLQAQGYNMDDIDFRQFRNASSGGTSSMDLDLGPISKTTGKEPSRILKNGKEVDIEVFMNDAQIAMNSEYKNLFGIDAPMSDMNLVTSKHDEAYATLKLLDKDVDFNQLTASEVASVGKVIEVKMKAIKSNKTMTNTAKLQAKCRESYKEVDNMLIKKLNAELSTQSPGSFEYKQTKDRISYWTDMNNRFKRIGTEEVDPMQIMQIEKEVYLETGGKTVNDVINDLMINFGHNPLTVNK